MNAHVQGVEPHQSAYGALEPRLLPRYRTRPLSLHEHALAADRSRGGVCPEVGAPGRNEIALRTTWPTYFSLCSVNGTSTNPNLPPPADETYGLSPLMANIVLTMLDEYVTNWPHGANTTPDQPSGRLWRGIGAVGELHALAYYAMPLPRRCQDRIGAGCEGNELEAFPPTLRLEAAICTGNQGGKIGKPS